jgi:hypothetical protein
LFSFEESDMDEISEKNESEENESIAEPEKEADK